MSRRAVLVDRKLLGVVGFTDHAIERFAERSGVGQGARRQIEPIARDLLLQEGRALREPPSWYRSSNAADGYLQVGEWMLFVLRGSRRQRGAYDVVTVLTNGDRTTWPVARRRGLVFTPPPLGPPPARPPRVGWLGSVVAGLRDRRRATEPIGRWAAIRRAHAVRVRAAGDGGVAAYEQERRRHADERRDAHERHLRRCGGA
ncbi:hypothetical protein VSS74_02695 [Conexibacter stalactiti]|uniref:Uncharacterized protein n=1 Tax=Conexibacter stalactiti TaxID=1940611 RepID=A0ABU4HIT4_9ACTN|nr:hypothetical protein [Conexibacter stalactiti]MDW5593230.1 hypothetical protein [Conexibacter stalactiti]MEC5033871.1 hypothetical protein [Conexibacter stalactiti]